MKGLKGMTEEQLQALAMKGLKVEQRQQRQWVRQHLLAKKAAAAGIKVSDEEITEYLTKNYRGKK